MAFTADELANINNSALEHYIDKGKVWTQNVANKPLLKALSSPAKLGHGSAHGIQALTAQISFSHQGLHQQLKLSGVQAGK